MTTSLIIKPEQKRLNRSIHTGVGQTNIRINLAPETGNRAQFARQMPEQRHHGSKRLDRSAEQRQGGREDVLLGECQLKQANIGDGLVFYVFGPSMRNAYVALGFGPERLELSSQSIWAFQCVAQAGHLRACVLRADETAAVELSQREHEILRWLARGKSNSVIASILSVSPHTIDAHVRRIYTKLDVNDRTSAVIRGIGSGLIKI